MDKTFVNQEIMWVLGLAQVIKLVVKLGLKWEFVLEL